MRAGREWEGGLVGGAGGGSGSGSNRARLLGLPGFGSTSSTTRRFIALGRGGGLSELLDSALRGGGGRSDCCKLSKTASDSGERERSLGGLNGAVRSLLVALGIGGGEGAGEGDGVTRSFSLPLFVVKIVESKSDDAWLVSLGPSSVVSSSALTLELVRVCRGEVEVISLELALVFTLREAESEDTVEEAEIPDKRGERRGVFCVRGGSSSGMLLNDVDAEDIDVGIDKSKVKLIFPIDEHVESSKLSGRTGTASVLDTDTVGASSVTANTGRARGVRELGLTSRDWLLDADPGAGLGSVSNTGTVRTGTVPVVPVSVLSSKLSGVGIGGSCVSVAGSFVSVEAGAETVSARRGDTTKSIGVGAGSSERDSASSIRSLMVGSWLATETSASS